MFELIIAKRYLSSDTKMVLFVLLSVALSIAVIVVLIGINEGYKNELVASLASCSARRPSR